MSLTNVLRCCLDFVLIPIGTWAGSIYLATNWIGRGASIDRSLVASTWMALALAAFTYQQGVKGVLAVGRVKYFLMVFAIPLLIAALGLAVGVVVWLRQ